MKRNPFVYNAFKNMHHELNPKKHPDFWRLETAVMERYGTIKGIGCIHDSILVSIVEACFFCKQFLSGLCKNWKNASSAAGKPE